MAVMVPGAKKGALKIMKRFQGVKVYAVLCIALLMLQLFPYLVIGEWYGMIHYFLIFPVMELLLRIDHKVLVMLVSSVMTSCILAWLAMLFALVLRRIGQRKTKREDGRRR